MVQPAICRRRGTTQAEGNWRLGCTRAARYRDAVLTDTTLLALLDEVANAVGEALASLDDWGLADTVPGQHHCDLVADAAALAILKRAGVGVLSEESGLYQPENSIVVVVDPVDGSTNAAQGVPWFATALCAVDERGPRVAVVHNHATGDRFDAVRGEGARRDGGAMAPSIKDHLDQAIVGLNGLPPKPLGAAQYRMLGAMAPDLCAVASGVLDGFVDCTPGTVGPWDYMGSLLVCREAGAVVEDAFGRELVVLEHQARRVPVAAGTPGLHKALMVARDWPR
ncbi:MAG: inositol monophosphatase/fructose,6-bisphosphatase family protein [Acidimicrobiia bacterium]|nr:inositol monophosphatase/fructose,6-bisphosphatase family protein [Acidimicrobiia bacterium]